MAANNEYVLRLTVDSAGATQAVDSFSSEVNQAVKNTGNLKQQLREMQKQLAELDPNSEAFQKLSKQAGEVKDKINDAAEAVKANAGNAFEGLSNNAGLLQDRLLNLDFEGVASSAKGLGANLKNVNFSDVSKGVGEIGKSFASLGKALLTNPLFLIIGGIALVVANFEKIASLFDGVTDAQQDQLEIQKQTAKYSKEQFDAISAQENSLRVQGKSEAEILKLKKDALNIAILNQEAAIQTQQVILDGQIKAAQRNKDILVGVLDFITAPIDLVLKGIDKIGSAFGKNFGLSDTFSTLKSEAANLVFDPEEVKAEGDAALKEQQTALIALQNQRDGFILDERAKSKAASEQRLKDQADALDAEIELRKKASEAAATVFELQQKINKQIFDDANKQRLNDIQSQTEAELKIISDREELARQLRLDGQQKEIEDIDAKYIALRELAHGDAELNAQLAEQNAQEVAAIEDKYRKQKIADETQVENARIDLASGVVGALDAISSSFSAKNEAQARRQFAINKGLQIAQALIQTYQGATGAYTSQLSIPSPDAPIRAAVAAGVAVATGLAQVNKIRSTTFNSSGGSGGGGGSVSAPSLGGGSSQGTQTAFNPVNTDFIGNRPPQALQAYVLAGQATTEIEKREKIERQARLG